MNIKPQATRRRKWPITIAIIIAAFSCPALTDSNPKVSASTQYTTVCKISDLGKHLTIREEAESWQAMVDKVKPTFTWTGPDMKGPARCQWGGSDMMWVSWDKKGYLQFTLDRAYRYKPKDKPAKWVLLSSRNALGDAPCLTFSINNWRSVVKLHKKAPESNYSPDGYAIVKLAHPKRGTVYEIVYPSIIPGHGRVVTQRYLFMLQDIKGKWRLIGETSESMGRGYRRTLQSKAVWTDKPNAPVRIELTQKFLYTQHTGSDSDPIIKKRDKIVYRKAVIAGPLPAKMQWTRERLYMLTLEGDTLEGIAQHLATWTNKGDRNKGDDRKLILETWKKGLIRLNPKLSQGKIPKGTRIHLPKYTTSKKVVSCPQFLRFN